MTACPVCGAETDWTPSNARHCRRCGTLTVRTMNTTDVVIPELLRNLRKNTGLESPWTDQSMALIRESFLAETEK